MIFGFFRDEGPITIQQFAEEVARPMVYSLIQELEEHFIVVQL
jgi:hypothetical protein